jgi:hypothetical protein
MAHYYHSSGEFEPMTDCTQMLFNFEDWKFLREEQSIQTDERWTQVFKLLENYHQFDSDECVQDCYETFYCAEEYGLNTCEINYCYTKCPHIQEHCTVKWSDKDGHYESSCLDFNYRMFDWQNTNLQC